MTWWPNFKIFFLVFRISRRKTNGPCHESKCKKKFVARTQGGDMWFASVTGRCQMHRGPLRTIEHGSVDVSASGGPTSTKPESTRLTDAVAAHTCSCDAHSVFTFAPNASKPSKDSLWMFAGATRPLFEPEPCGVVRVLDTVVFSLSCYQETSLNSCC